MKSDGNEIRFTERINICIRGKNQDLECGTNHDMHAERNKIQKKGTNEKDVKLYVFQHRS